MPKTYNTSPIFGDKGSPLPGEVYVCPDPQKRCWPESWIVCIMGDGTLEGDTITRGIFWHKEDAESFAAILEPASKEV